MPRKRKTFDGADYVDERDGERLTNQYDTIFNIMKDGTWRSVRQIRKLTGYPQNSIQAQLRHSRKKKFGSHELNKKYKKKGLYLYQIIVNPNYSETSVSEIGQNFNAALIEQRTISTNDDNQPSPIAELPPAADCKKTGKKERPLPLFLFLEQQEQVIPPIEQSEVQIS
jgi:hypothetical protein